MLVFLSFTRQPEMEIHAVKQWEGTCGCRRHGVIYSPVAQPDLLSKSERVTRGCLHCMAKLADKLKAVLVVDGAVFGLGR